MTRPDILLLDEPTVGLDPLMEAEFQSLTREAAARGQTVFLSSHLLDEVEDLFHRVANLRSGILVEVAALEDLRRLTTTIFEASLPEPTEMANLRDLLANAERDRQLFANTGLRPTRASTPPVARRT